MRLPVHHHDAAYACLFGGNKISSKLSQLEDWRNVSEHAVTSVWCAMHAPPYGRVRSLYIVKL